MENLTFEAWSSMFIARIVFLKKMSPANIIYRVILIKLKFVMQISDRTEVPTTKIGVKRLSFMLC